MDWHIGNVFPQTKTFLCVSVPGAPVIDYDASLKKPQAVKAGASITINVTITGVPTPEVRWFLDETELETGGDITIETSEGSSRITIKKASAKDAGKYVVAAENEAGEASAEFEVIVKGELKHCGILDHFLPTFLGVKVISL